MLIENQSYPQDVRVRHEAEALTAAGHEVTVLAPRASGQSARETIRGVDVERFRLPIKGTAPVSLVLEYLAAHIQLFARSLRHLFRGVDVIHLHNPPDTLFPAGIAARWLGGTMIFDNHDLTPELFEGKFGSSPLVRLLQRMQRISMRVADLVVTSNESQAELASSVRADSDGAGVVVVRNGPLRAEFGNPAVRDGALADPRLAYLGELAPQDGVLALVDLLLTLREEHGIAARMSVIGDGPARADLESAVGAAGLSDVVTFHGWVASSEVPRLLASADICVDPAPCNRLNHHSTMTKVAEYLAAARPVVAYELWETRRTVGDAALLAPCGQAQELAKCVARVSNDDALRKELTDRAIKRRELVAWERSAEALVDAYARIAERPRRLA